jgi:hypothetical protein
MSSGPSDKSKLVSLSPEEFNSVVKRVHNFLVNRAEKAKEKMIATPTPRSELNEVEAAKDVFVFVHMMELIEYMSNEIHDLRDMVHSSVDEMDTEPEMPEMYTAKKTSYPN